MILKNENSEEHNKKWSCIPDQPYRILIIGGSGSGKTSVLLNFIMIILLTIVICILKT